MKASETNLSSPKLKESENNFSQEKLVKASNRNLSLPEQKELANASEDVRQSSQKKSTMALEHEIYFLGKKELTKNSEKNISSPIYPKRKSARENYQSQVTVCDMISKVIKIL